MSLEKTNTVDAVGIEKATGKVVLTIADSWNWQDEAAHLSALKEKLNAYGNFIESGEIWESYPQSQGRKVVIDVVSRFPVPMTAMNFLKRVSALFGDAGTELRISYGP